MMMLSKEQQPQPQHRPLLLRHSPRCWDAAVYRMLVVCVAVVAVARVAGVHSWAPQQHTRVKRSAATTTTSIAVWPPPTKAFTSRRHSPDTLRASSSSSLSLSSSSNNDTPDATTSPDSSSSASPSMSPGSDRTTFDQAGASLIEEQDRKRMEEMGDFDANPAVRSFWFSSRWFQFGFVFFVVFGIWV